MCLVMRVIFASFRVCIWSRETTRGLLVVRQEIVCFPRIIRQDLKILHEIERMPVIEYIGFKFMSVMKKLSPSKLISSQNSLFAACRNETYHYQGLDHSICIFFSHVTPRV